MASEKSKKRLGNQSIHEDKEWSKKQRMQQSITKAIGGDFKHFSQKAFNGVMGNNWKQEKGKSNSGSAQIQKPWLKTSPSSLK